MFPFLSTPLRNHPIYFPMPKTHSSSSVETAKKKKITRSVSLHGLSKIQEDGKAKHLKAPKTSSKYLEMVIAGRKWLDEHCKQDGTPPLDASLPQNELPQFDSADNDDDARDLYYRTEFLTAFNKVPNEYSPTVLALYITYKCMHQHLKAGTGASIRAAFKHVWDYSCVDSISTKNNVINFQQLGEPLSRQMALQHHLQELGGKPCQLCGG